jgi:hypothetical protein
MRQDASGAGYGRRAFVHKRPLEPFTLPAAVGPVIGSADAHLSRITILRRCDRALVDHLDQAKAVA